MELVENASPVPVALTPSQAVSIADTSTHWRKKLRLREDPIRLSTGPNDSYLIEARGVAGFIRVGEITLEIAPKFVNRETAGAGWRAAMWRFLAYSHGIQALSDAAGSPSREEGIADVLADMFMASLKGASARGYPVGYRTSAFSTPFLRGRLDPKEYATLVPPTGKLRVLAPALTTDTPTNRLLKWAGSELAATVEEPQRRQQLINWSGELPGVLNAPPSPQAVPLPRRHHPYLVHAVEIAKLLLDDWEAGYKSGELLLPGFLWDSENLFERAARRLASDACRSLGLSAVKVPLPLARLKTNETAARLDTTPDITIQASGAPLFLMDAKYKVLGEHPNNADVYQVLAGGRVAGVGSVALLYPAGGTSLTISSYVPFGEGLPNLVSAVTIGLGAFSSRSGLRSLRDEFASWISQQTS
jgi:5-methylcytosine-specific restriction endonuclease McrBC regulatory subunit McrC